MRLGQKEKAEEILKQAFDQSDIFLADLSNLVIKFYGNDFHGALEM
jgi:hypothetical protein